jgi:hypothetical protein
LPRAAGVRPGSSVALASGFVPFALMNWALAGVAAVIHAANKAVAANAGARKADAVEDDRMTSTPWEGLARVSRPPPMQTLSHRPIASDRRPPSSTKIGSHGSQGKTKNRAEYPSEMRTILRGRRRGWRGRPLSVLCIVTA